jgi:hypothetical protein
MPFFPQILLLCVTFSWFLGCTRLSLLKLYALWNNSFSIRLWIYLFIKAIIIYCWREQEYLEKIWWKSLTNFFITKKLYQGHLHIGRNKTHNLNGWLCMYLAMQIQLPYRHIITTRIAYPHRPWLIQLPNNHGQNSFP